MKASERNELIRIIKGRFKLLRQEAKSRAYEIYEAEQRRLDAALSDKIASYNDRADAINAAASSLIGEANDLWREVEKDETLSLSGSVYGQIISMRLRAYRPSLLRGVSEVDPIVQHVQHELDRAELGMIEEVLVGKFETEEAKKFLAKIPTVNSLLEGKISLTREINA